MKITKQQLLERIELIEGWMDGADEMLTELNHALPDPEYGAKCEAQEADVEASLNRHRERLGLNKPQLKQLDQSIFDGLDEGWRFAAVDGNKGFPIVYEFEPYAFESGKYYSNHHGLYKDLTHLTGYDTSNWQNSLIERDLAKELTGSELCRAMLERGDKFVMCANQSAYDDWPRAIALNERGRMYYISGEYSYDANDSIYPINNQGEPLTQAEAGL